MKRSWTCKVVVVGALVGVGLPIGTMPIPADAHDCRYVVVQSTTFGDPTCPDDVDTPGHQCVDTPLVVGHLTICTTTQ
jgi:hypothetical protein